jgi:hypothetical protein
MESVMKYLPFVIASAVLLTGCGMTDQQFLASEQAAAIQVADARGEFELNCPQANASILSSKVVQPNVGAPMILRIPPRAEYTIGVAGCGKRATYLILCPNDGSGCFAGGGRTEIY